MINTQPTQRCAIYTRQSRTTEASFTSCEAQHESALAIIRAHVAEGWQWNEKHYADEGEGGASIDRPALQRLLADVRNHEVDRVIVYRLDRLASKQRDSVRLINEFREHNVAFIIVTDPNLGYCAEHTLLLNILGAFSEFEYEMTRERLAEARAARKSKGKRVAGRVPYGYITDRNTKQLISHPTEGRRVCQFFRWAEMGYTPSDIASNGAHRALVDEATFDAVDKISARALSSTKRNTEIRTWDWALDNRRMGKSFGKRGPQHYPNYKCRSHSGGRGPCKGVSILAYDLEQSVCDIIGEAPEFADLHSAWRALTLDDQRELLPRVVERCDYDKERLRLTLVGDATERLHASPCMPSVTPWRGRIKGTMSRGGLNAIDNRRERVAQFKG